MCCVACDGGLIPGAKFCGHCGAPIERGATAAGESDDGGKRPRRLRYVVGVAAAAALVVGVALARPDSGDDEQVEAASPTSTTTAGASRSAGTDEGQVSGDQPDATEESIPGDLPVPDAATAGPIAAMPNSAASGPDVGMLPVAPAPQGGPPAPPPPPPLPPTTSPPGPAALVVESDCVTRCTIPRGGRVELRVINFGGQTGRFTVEVSEGIDPRPRRGSVGGGETRIVELVETAGKRRAYRVDVLDEDGVLLFRTSVSVGG
jgi:hypothetical protein